MYKLDLYNMHEQYMMDKTTNIHVQEKPVLAETNNIFKNIICLPIIFFFFRYKLRVIDEITCIFD